MPDEPTRPRFRIALVVAAVGAVAALGAGVVAMTGSDDRSSPQTGGPTVTAPPPPPSTDGRNPGDASRRADQQRFRRMVNRRCRRAGDAADTLARLESLQRRLRRLDPPGGMNRAFAAYRRALDREIFLEQRIRRARAARDEQSTRIGDEQNDFNRDQRDRLASMLRLSNCRNDLRP